MTMDRQDFNEAKILNYWGIRIACLVRGTHAGFPSLRLEQASLLRRALGDPLEHE